MNPFYLFANNTKLPILEHATNLMLNRPRKLARRFYKRCLKSMEKRGPVWPGAEPRIVVIGLGFKPGQSEISGSPGLIFLQMLHELGCIRLAYYDPMVSKQPFKWLEKLGDMYWTAPYIDSKFDGLYICNSGQDNLDLSLVKSLQTTLVASYVHL